MARRQPASLRHNNSGAQYPGPVARQFGSTGFSVIGGGHKIATFDTPEAGAAAHFGLLAQRYSGLTVEGAIKKWSGGNSNSAYTNFVTRSSGLQPSDRLTPEVLSSPRGLQMVRAMATWEAGGQRYPLDDNGWARAQEAGLGSARRLEELRTAQVASSQPATAAPQESEATRRMMQGTTEPWQRISPLPSTAQAPQMGVVDPMSEGITPVERETVAPTRPLQPASGPRDKTAAAGWPSWAVEAFERQGNMPVNPVSAISPVDLVPAAPPSSKVLFGDQSISPMWNRQQKPFANLLSAMFGGGGF